MLGKTLKKGQACDSAHQFAGVWQCVHHVQLNTRNRAHVVHSHATNNMHTSQHYMYAHIRGMHT